MRVERVSDARYSRLGQEEQVREEEQMKVGRAGKGRESRLGRVEQMMAGGTS